MKARKNYSSTIKKYTANDKNQMKTKLLITIKMLSLLALGCYAAGAIGTAAENNENAAPSHAEAAAEMGALAVSPTPEKTNKPAAAVKPQKAVVKEPLPEKVDNETAYSPVYKINSKNCKNLDGEGGEGEDFTRKCKAYGNYSLYAYGFTGNINYRVESENPKDEFYVVLFPLETGDAAKYVRADLYSIKLADKIEWRLDEKGKPYAIFVRAAFYKNKGAKTFTNPKNKVAEFVLLRGLAGYKQMDYDIATVGTAYNPDEQARMAAYKYFEKHRK